MTEAQIQKAIIKVARRAVFDVLRTHEPDWEDFPHVGEYDWVRVLAAFRVIAAQYQDNSHEFDVAYARLMRRADQVGGNLEQLEMV